MPRPPRIYTPDVSLHVFQRGLNYGSIVEDDDDRDHLLRLIPRAASRHGVGVHAFALMTTHHHMVVTPTAPAALPKMMQELGIRYTRYFNRKYGRIGTIWNERYGAILLEDERYWFVCLRYVELNPYNARMVATPEAYRWTSYRVHAFGERCEWLTSHPLYEALGRTAAERQTAYRAICAIPFTDEELTLHVYPPAIGVVQRSTGA